MRSDAKDQRAREIEAAAYRVLEEKGYAGMSMLAVAKTAKASNETLYRWYGDKLGLFEALIHRNTDLVLAELEPLQQNPQETDLEALGITLLTMLLGPRAVALNRAAAADGSGKLGTALRQAGRDSVAPLVAGLMERLVAQGSLQNAAPPELADCWFTLLIGDLQLRRVTGALAPLSDTDIAARSQRANRQLRQLYPPA